MSSRPDGAKAGFSTPLWNQAYYRIRERILRGEFSPGEALSARRLAEEFGMSLSPYFAGLPATGKREVAGESSAPELACAFRTLKRYADAASSVKLSKPNRHVSASCMRAWKERVELLRLAEQLDTLYDRFGQGGDADPVRSSHAPFRTSHAYR